MSKKVGGYLLLALAIGIIAFQYMKYRVPPELDVNSLQLTTLNSESYAIDFTKNDLTVISFFATWCGTCHEEFRQLQQLKAEGKLKQAELYAISDESYEKLNCFTEVYKYEYTNFLKSEKSVGSIGIHAFPTIFILNKKGEVISSKVGLIDWTDENWVESLIN